MAFDLGDPLLNEKQLANWLGISVPNLQRRRSDGSGPPFVQLSERRIGYRKSAVERWLEKRTINRVGELSKPTSLTSARARGDGA
jgi:predicted DNA-binding transcriptional regulator AlpA